MNYATASSFAGLEATERAVPAGAVVAVTVALALPDGDAPPVRDRIRMLGWVLTNPARLEGKIRSANAAVASAASLHGASRAAVPGGRASEPGMA